MHGLTRDGGEVPVVVIDAVVFRIVSAQELVVEEIAYSIHGDISRFSRLSCKMYE